MKITVNGQTENCRKSETLYDVAQKHAAEYEHPIALAVVNGRLRELFHRVRKDDDVAFLTITDNTGYEALRRSYSMLFLVAVRKLYGRRAGKSVLHFAKGNGFYFTLDGEVEIDAAFLAEVSAEMRKMASEAIPFQKRSVKTADARRLFADLGMHDKERLFRTRISSQVNVYSLEGYDDYYYGYMLHDTGGLDRFELIPYHDGVVLQLPLKHDPAVIPPFESSEKVFEAQIQGEQWAERLHIGTVGDLNACIIEGGAGRMMLISEALQESSIAGIATKIEGRKSVRFVMIAGPSSSGKTTFSQRLAIQLAAHGLSPRYIGVDNYFIDRDKMPVGEDGKMDFEALSAVDVEQFNKDMTDLLDGKTIRVPTFDFVQGKRVYSGETLTLGEGEILVIEGIHCLNDELSFRLPKKSKFKIYISALTQLNIDEHNRVPSGDGRLLRRIIRDNRTRGYSASQTIAMWNSVRSGETKYIFPYQESADVVFNSALPYELAALKNYAQPLLLQIREDDPSYFEAKRLLKFLDYFVAVETGDIPMNSILREFIGGGCFRL